MNVSVVTSIHKTDDMELAERSLQSVMDWADEVVIADIGIESQLKKRLKANKKVRLVEINHEVPYIELIRQKMIDKAEHDWILLLDVDEIFPKTLLSYLKDHAHDADYFAIPRKNIILGHWMQHSRWWPDPQIRFFKKESAKWSTRIHSQPQLKGTVHEVPHEAEYAMEHYNYRTYDQYLDKSRRYARAEAEDFVERKESLTPFKALKLGTSEFISRYYADNGYKDGTHGFVMAFSQLMYYFQVYVYYWEIKDMPQTDNKTLTELPSKFFAHALHESLHWSRAKKLVKDPVTKVKAAILRRL